MRSQKGIGLVMLVIIVIYGILGLLSGWAKLKFGIKKNN